jgi:hypothetical protein
VDKSACYIIKIKDKKKLSEFELGDLCG